MADAFDPYYQWLGIPPKHQPPDHYRLLALEQFETNLDVIENAADQRMQHVRSFQNGPHGEVSQRLLNEITAAKLCLLNVAKKAEYDQKLRAERDAAEPRRLQPLPRVVRATTPSEPEQAAPETEVSVPAPLPSTGPTFRKRRRAGPQQAAIVGAALGILIVAAIFYATFQGSSQDRALSGKAGKSSTAIQPKSAASPFETKTDDETGPRKTPEKTPAAVTPVRKPEPKSDPPAPAVVYLDDLPETEFSVAEGTALGKGGLRGVANLEAVLKGQRYPHAVGTHPGTGMPAHVVYDLGRRFGKFQAIAGLLDVEGESETHSLVTFKVFGDGKLLWESTPVQRLGTAQSLEIDLDEVKTLRLEVHCQGDYGLAHAAWIDPRLTPARDASYKDYVWLEDDAPAGARLKGDTPWEWVSKPQPVFSGAKSMRRSAADVSQHFFDSAKAGMILGEGDRFFAYVYLDPAKMPRNITLQFRHAPDWEHRAFWGEDSVTSWGQPNTPSRRGMGALPPPGQWVRLEVPVERVGLKPGDIVTGMAFAQHGGTVFWDRVGLATRTRQAIPSAAQALIGQPDTPARPPPPALRVSHWLLEGGVQFKFSETEKGIVLELVPGTSKLYSKIRIPLSKAGELWSGTGTLYFRSSPERRYDARIEILKGDPFSGTTMEVRTICPDANMRTKSTDVKAKWTKKD